ncbi:MAG TPA: butyrate kinase, partial [Tenuifilaceae bacterium]|nr:butyrate kinase [Tenuifilaceae bacterium]
RIGILGEHASNLGGLIADDIAKSLPSAKAYIADPVVVDELQEVARVAGHPEFSRVSIFHALNQKAIARTYAKSLD